MEPGDLVHVVFPNLEEIHVVKDDSHVMKKEMTGIVVSVAPLTSRLLEVSLLTDVGLQSIGVPITTPTSLRVQVISKRWRSTT